jgi:ornithine cyclodeaminase/alanine dehydrogenase-like protein (mu-crystallin family)
VCLATGAAEPVVDAAWIAPGAHVTSVGFHPPGSEVPPELFDGARIFVEARSAYDPPPAGCTELAGRDPQAGTELGEVLAGRRAGRTSHDELTLFKSMGHVAEDLAAAALALHEAEARGRGRRIGI